MLLTLNMKHAPKIFVHVYLFILLQFPFVKHKCPITFVRHCTLGEKNKDEYRNNDFISEVCKDNEKIQLEKTHLTVPSVPIKLLSFVKSTLLKIFSLITLLITL